MQRFVAVRELARRVRGTNAPISQSDSLLPTILPQASVLAEDTKDSDSVMVLEVLPLAGSPT